jgi:hypothetical protein
MAAKTKSAAKKRAAKKASAKTARKSARKVAAGRAARSASKKTPASGARKTVRTPTKVVVESSPTLENGAGRVYVFDDSGLKSRRTHVAKKASAGEIRKKLGISRFKQSSVKTLLDKLTSKGLIR